MSSSSAYTSPLVCPCQQRILYPNTHVCIACGAQYCSQSCQRSFLSSHELSCKFRVLSDKFVQKNAQYLRFLGCYYRAWKLEGQCAGAEIRFSKKQRVTFVRPLSVKQVESLFKSDGVPPTPMFSGGYPDCLVLTVRWPTAAFHYEINLVVDELKLAGELNPGRKLRGRFLTIPEDGDVLMEEPKAFLMPLHVCMDEKNEIEIQPWLAMRLRAMGRPNMKIQFIKWPRTHADFEEWMVNRISQINIRGEEQEEQKETQTVIIEEIDCSPQPTKKE
jgi:hypothetical protein